MSLNLDSVENVLREAVMAVTDLDNNSVVIHYPNAPRPALPYASLQYISSSENVGEWRKFNKVTHLVETYGSREVLYSLQFYGNGARQLSTKAQTGLQLQSIREGYVASGVPFSVLRIEKIDLDSTLLDSDYEERSILDIVLNVYIEDGSTEEDLGYFNTVDPNWTNKP